ncbi:hypothetical protein E1A91_A08G105500v1 [Gossypium mustelinum]|uniref:Uncharacterized protein isoform X3 n=3 Tax=Gossypium TaxID=3633 RepID=A0ABM2YJF9_GOSHI|nr:uncharacterized protein LOC107943902 isoform X3 [Gossypium hirsutum]TYI14220.1 hypothetical protein ES332_A08G108800v1 [Gossypium tomentosum]TYJ22114.1 hypothetical protein E1A91_A08G105500v1 [Gossypium mustelinum]
MEQPSSPGTKPVELSNSIEELLKFTLKSHLNGTLGLDIGLSKQFCSSLLNHPSTSPISPNASSSSEASQNPLYKQLILKNINFELHVQEPFFTQLKDGIKAVEGRCAVGDYNRITTGALILFNKCLVLEVQDVHYYASFFEMLEAESLAKVLPGVKTIDEGVQVYRKFYTEEKEKTNGVAAICVAKMAAQPYLSLARILSEIIQRQKESGLLVMLQHRAWMSQHSKQNTQGAVCHQCRDTDQRMSRHIFKDMPK